MKLLIDKKDIVFSFAAGSKIEGFGNPDSDTDIYIIYKGQVRKLKEYQSNKGELFIHQKYNTIHWYKDNNNKYDIEYISIEELERTIQELNRITLNKERKIIPIDNKEFNLLHRFKKSKSLINTREYDRYYKMVNFNNLSLQMVVLRRHKYIGLLEDLEGSIKNNDYGTAYIEMRMAVENILCAYLACYDETNPNEKWLYKKVESFTERTGNKEIKNGYIDLISMPFIPQTLDKQINKFKKYCTLLEEHIEKSIEKYFLLQIDKE